MSVVRKIPAIDAPAGDFTSLQAAVQNGCDAVYLGLQQLNMRAMSRNFSIDDLPAVKEICDEAGVEINLTVNTIVFDPERDEAERMLRAATPFIDGVICWDPAIIELCRKLGIPYHVSTQASVANTSSALFYQRLGAKRITLARECSLEELRAIKDKSGLELEVFGHGAMCVSISGRCFISQFLDGKSANRGECLQHCRREFLIRDSPDPGREELRLGSNYIMSAQDLCTIPFLDKLVATGIDYIKIEGRGKSANYVATVTRCYRRALDAIAENCFDDDLKKELLEDLKSVYNRDFSNGFYFNRPISDFTDVHGSKATEKKVYVGEVTNYYRKLSVAEIRVLDREFEIGDKLLFEGPATGSRETVINEIRQNDIQINKAERGFVTTPVVERVRRNDSVYQLATAGQKE